MLLKSEEMKTVMPQTQKPEETKMKA